MKRRAGNRKINSGFTLIELMISLVLGLLVLLGVGKAFLAVKVMNDRGQLVSSRAEALGYISNVLSYEIRSASSLSPVASNNPVDSAANLQVDYPPGFDSGVNNYCADDDFGNSLEYYVQYNAALDLYDFSVFYECGVNDVEQAVISSRESFFVVFNKSDPTGICDSAEDNCIRMTICFDSNADGDCGDAGDEEVFSYFSARQFDNG